MSHLAGIPMTVQSVCRGNIIGNMQGFAGYPVEKRNYIVESNH